MVALTSNFSVSYQPEITATGSTFEFVSVTPSTLFLMCDSSYWFKEPEDLRYFLNNLRIQGYRKDLFDDNKIQLPMGISTKQFRKSDYNLKMKHRNWKNKELNN